MTDKVLIGKITGVHGLKGQVKIMSFSQNPQDIGNYPKLFDKNNKELAIKITSKAQGKNNDVFIANIANIKDRNAAEDLRNTEIFINKADLPESEDDGFYYVDLIGLDVLSQENEKIGQVQDVMNYGAGDIIEIDFNEKSKQKEKIQMFSFRDEIFPEVDLEKKFIKIIFPDVAEIK